MSKVLSIKLIKQTHLQTIGYNPNIPIVDVTENLPITCTEFASAISILLVERKSRNWYVLPCCDEIY